eukprot:6470439-Amphidinium_carterae.1
MSGSSRANRHCWYDSIGWTALGTHCVGPNILPPMCKGSRRQNNKKGNAARTARSNGDVSAASKVGVCQC